MNRDSNIAAQMRLPMEVKRLSKLDELRARGCTCGLDDENLRPIGNCPIHEAGDNRGLRAHFEAGLPLGFPTRMTCARCSRFADMARDEATKIADAAEAAGRDLTDDEREQIEIYARAYEIGKQDDCLGYPHAIEGNAPAPDDAVEWYDAMAAPTLICPRCSTPAAEARLVSEALRGAFVLNEYRVFDDERPQAAPKEDASV